MSATEGQGSDRSPDPSVKNVDLKLEVVVIPVSNVDRAKKFYGGLGWRLDADFAFETVSRSSSSPRPARPARSSSERR